MDSSFAGQRTVPALRPGLAACINVPTSMELVLGSGDVFIFVPQVNARYRRLELGFDGLYKVILLLKKKKYAAIKLEESPGGAITEVCRTSEIVASSQG